MEILFCEIKEKATSFNNKIDTFEDFINFVQRKMSDLSHVCTGGYVKYKFVGKLENKFDNFVQKVRNFLCEINMDAKTEISKRKQDFVEHFEDFGNNLQEIVDTIDIKFKKHVNSLRLVKSELIEGFENIRQDLNDNITNKRQNIKDFVATKKATIVSDFDILFDDLKLDVDYAQKVIERRKSVIVDEFEEIIENTKWTVADRKSAFIQGAESVFENAREQLENIIEEGRNEIKQEVESINYVLKMGECVLTEFIHYCECTANEFFQFSDKRAVTLIQDGTRIMKSKT